MKRPVSILCLADIHYEISKDMDVVNSLCKCFSDYVFSDEKNYKWIPDYLVIAGDLVQQNGSYEGLHEFINKFCQEFCIDNSHIVIVPGNHDKNTGECPLLSKEEGLKTQKDIFEAYCGKPKKENKIKFEREFGCRFKKFIEFCDAYNGNELQFEKSEEESPKESILDKKMWCLSGVKVFDEDHLCFLCVNTEWLYTDGRSKAKVTLGSDNITEYMRLDEDCHLCSPHIKKACKLIQENYSDHTIVSVMHRGFDHFSWEERNNSDSSLIDSIEYIINTSNIIITGHDHMFNPKPPTLIDNKVQHFQLGSVGRKELYDSEYSRFAEVIRIDAPNNRIEQLYIQHCRDRNTPHWKCNVSDRTYPLISRYASVCETEACDVDHARIKVNYPIPEKIEKAICRHFQQEDLVIIPANSKIKDELKKQLKINSEKNVIQIVVYYLYNEDKYLKRNVKREIDEFREENIKTIIQNKIIIHEVIVVFPQYGSRGGGQKKMNNS